MKKILIVLLCILFLTSCSTTSSRFTIVEVSGFDTHSVANHNNDINLNVENYNKLLKPNKALTINDEFFNSQYTRTTKGYLYNNEIDYYEYTDNGILVQFGVNADTDNIDIYSYLDVNYTTKKGTSAVLTENECLSVALEYLDNYVDANEYTLLNSNYSKIPEYNAVYDFKFVRLVDDIETSDNAYIGVTVFGDVISHMFGTVNEMNSVPAPSSEDYTTIDANIQKKIKSIYDPIKDNYDYTYEQTNKRFIKLSDGTYALEYDISVTIKPKNPLAKELVEAVKLLVYLE